MSDYISRKALIDTIEKNCYPIRYDRCSEENGMTVTGIMQAINEQPTAFDLERVIEQIREESICPYPFNRRFVYLDIVGKILKSAANTTNGKNGG